MPAPDEPIGDEHDTEPTPVAPPDPPPPTCFRCGAAIDKASGKRLGKGPKASIIVACPNCGTDNTFAADGHP